VDVVYISRVRPAWRLGGGFAIAGEGEREHWFALCTVLRTAGLAAGGVIAGATVALGGKGGFIGVAAANAASFVLAAAGQAERLLESDGL
jgi:hypothetical protein